MKHTVLLIDDDHGIAVSTRAVIGETYSFHHANNAGNALNYLNQHQVEIVLLDIHMPGTPTEQILNSILTLSPHTQIIMYTASSDIRNVITFIKMGAFSYLVKGDHSNDDLHRTLSSAVKNYLSAQKAKPISTVKARKSYYKSENPKMQDLLKLAKKLSAAENIPILITGETGVGKERLAEYIHDQSPRKNGPFISVNCGAIPENLIESELFGHEKGAFTDASEMRRGCFERAQGGSVFLDEIACMDPNLQVRLLRVLQEKVVQRVGGTELIPLDIRIISATNEDLNTAISAQKFRQDLYYRINGIELKIPPLRDRKEDIYGLFMWFLESRKHHYNISDIRVNNDLITLLKLYQWPGNSRELETFVEVLLALADDSQELSIDSVPNEWLSRLKINYDDIKVLSDEQKKKQLLTIIDACKGNVTLAARLLDIDRSTIYRIIN